AEAKTNTSLSEAIKSILPVGGNPSRPDNFGTHSYNEFSGSTISINNTTGEAKVSANPNANFEDFTINGTQVLLLSRSSDKLKESIPVRALEAADFPAGGFNPKHTDNPGWVGSIGQGYGAFDKVRFGVYTDADNVSHLFVHGEPARFIYNAGAYQYEGSAVFGKNGAYQGLGNALTAIADFNSKNIDFTMKVNDSDTLKFGGKISGNTFAGTQNHIETRGGFFGYNDLGGMLNVLDGKYKGYNGTFGATETKALRRD
ncbi:MAG: hypothetical protein Q4E77_05940, partial [Conchiformibius sp.]|nr:hypothetical protein [Conchiformibius sp.]